MDLLKNILTPWAPTNNGLHDTLKLVVIGGTVETARRVSVSAWNGFVDSFFLTAHFNQDDYPYDWIIHWLSKQPAWGRSREVDITTRSANRNGMTQSIVGDLEDEEEEGDDALVHGRRKRKVAFMPSLDTTHTIFYRGHWLRITRTEKHSDSYSRNGASIKISVVARNNDILKKLVLEAKREYEKDAEHRVHIFMADTGRSYPCWRWNGARAKRPMSSIVLQPGVKDMILADCKDFLCSEQWYAERGIPFRRGYLLHGVPGSGKTSLIHSLAGELGLDIYVVSLSSKGMSDNTLTTLMGNVPSRCILLLEDLDAAFTRGINRDSTSTGAPPASGSSSKEDSKEKDKDDGSTLSLSGLLNSLDGVAAAEGRLLFATTNHIERLDPALSRPGRMDVWVNFTNATKWQAEGIFKCFFPFKPLFSTQQAPSTTSSSGDTSQKNIPGLKRARQTVNVPQLTEDEISDLAKKFADAIPEDEFSVASLQGYLLKNKTRPKEAVEEVGKWIIEERETREKLKQEKEKAELEAKEKEEQAAQEKKKDDTQKGKASTKIKSEKVLVKPKEPAASGSATTESSPSSSTAAESKSEENDQAATTTTPEEKSSKDSEDQEQEKWVKVHPEQSPAPENDTTASATTSTTVTNVDTAASSSAETSSGDDSTCTGDSPPSSNENAETKEEEKP